MEITQKWTDRLENTFSKSLNTFLASEFHTQLDSSVIKTVLLLRVWKTFPKVISKKTYNFSMK